MASMLPGVAVGALGAVGITGSSALARTLSPVAEPLFIASAALILISALACSRLVLTLSGAGVALLYVSMFVLAAGGAAGERPLSSTPRPATTPDAGGSRSGEPVTSVGSERTATPAV
jgi:hypothetical protein